MFSINMGSTLSFAFGVILITTSSSFDFNANLYNYEIVFERVLTESAHSADKIKFLEKNDCLYHSIKLHDASRWFQLEVPRSVRPY